MESEKFRSQKNKKALSLEKAFLREWGKGYVCFIAFSKLLDEAVYN